MAVVEIMLRYWQKHILPPIFFGSKIGLQGIGSVVSPTCQHHSYSVLAPCYGCCQVCCGSMTRGNLEFYSLDLVIIAKEGVILRESSSELSSIPAIFAFLFFSFSLTSLVPLMPPYGMRDLPSLSHCHPKVFLVGQFEIVLWH